MVRRETPGGRLREEMQICPGIVSDAVIVQPGGGTPDPRDPPGCNLFLTE
jgi:hypothetical protein